MNNFTFYSPTEFVFGRETENKVGELCKRHGASRIMIVYGGGSVVRSGLLKKVEASLAEQGIAFCQLPGVQPNPVDTKVYEGLELAKHFHPDFLLPVGGGSTIDTAKAIAVGHYYEGDFWDFYIGKAKPTRALPVGVVHHHPCSRQRRLRQHCHHQYPHACEEWSAHAHASASQICHHESGAHDDSS